MEGVTHRVFLHPLPLPLLRLAPFLLVHVISEFVICHNKGIHLLSVTNAVGVIVILRRGLDDPAESSQFVEESHVIRDLSDLAFPHAHCIDLFLLSHLLVGEKIVWQETDYLMPVLLEEFESYL